MNMIDLNIKSLHTLTKLFLKDMIKKDKGYIREDKIENSSYCERCFKIIHYGEYSVLDKKIDTDGIIRNINSDTVASVAFLVDSLNINDNIKKYINY